MISSTKRCPFPSAALATLLATFLSACGGGGGGDAPGGGTTITPVASAQADTFSAPMDKVATLSVLGNDSATGGGKPTLVSVTAPAHGTAVISGDTIVYTPSATYFGPDKFSYTINAGGTTASASAEVSLKVTAALTLSGRVAISSNDPSTNNGALMVANVGGRTYQGTAHSGGLYSIPVTLESPTEMISVTGQGSVLLGFYKNVSLVGDARTALAASAGGTVSANQLPGLNVSTVSTATYAVARRHNNGVVPATQAAFEAALFASSLSEVFDSAALLMLNLPAHPSVPNPIGTLATDTMDLALRSDAFRTFALPYLKSGAQANSLEQIRARGLASLPAFVPAAGRTIVLSPGEQHTSLLYTSEIAFESATRATVTGNGLRHRATVSREGDVLLLTLDQPMLLESYGPNGSVDFSVTHLRIGQFSGSAGVGSVRVLRSGTGRTGGTFAVDAPYEATEISGFVDMSLMTAVSASDFEGRTLAGVPDLQTEQLFRNPASQLTVTFLAGGAATIKEHPTRALTWSVADGRLKLVFADGGVQDMARMGSYNGAEFWLSRYVRGARVETVAGGLVAVQPGLAFTESSAVDTYLNINTSNSLLAPFTISLTPNHAGVELVTYFDGTTSAPVATSWALQSGRLQVSRYRTGDGTRVAVCPVNTYCELFSRRDWNLIGEAGGVVTVMDRYSLGPDVVITRLLRYKRAK